MEVTEKKSAFSQEDRLEKVSLLAKKLAKLSLSEYASRQFEMMSHYRLLETRSIPNHTAIHHPEAQHALITLESPALSVFTDFKNASAETIHPQTLASQAIAEMKAAKVQSLIVINDEGEILGLVSLKDLQGLKTGRIAQSHGLNFTEISVEHLMTTLEKLTAIDFKLLAGIKVGHIARLIHEQDLQHLLVLDYDEEKTAKIRGIFSATRIARQLGIDTPLGSGSSHSLHEMHGHL